MNVEMHNKKMYDKFGKEYQKSRDEKWKNRLYNEYLEVPSMIKAVGKIKGKNLLDVGCGAGVHIEQYLKKGAKCSGIDISKTLIDLARERCPEAEFKVGTMTKLPYKNNSFDIVTISLALHYVEDTRKVFREVNRILKKNGLIYYSSDSLIYLRSEGYQDKNYKIKGICEFYNKRTKQTIILGAKKEGLTEWEMLPGMKLKTFRKQFRNQLKDLIATGFELVDIIDCEPTLDFKKADPEEYKFVSRIPVFTIFIGRKK